MRCRRRLVAVRRESVPVALGRRGGGGTVPSRRFRAGPRRPRRATARARRDALHRRGVAVRAARVRGKPVRLVVWTSGFREGNGTATRGLLR
jgi:hypothetical protein